MIRINQMKLPVNHTEAQLKMHIEKMLYLSAETKYEYSIVKKSIDSRKKPEIWFVYSIDVSINGFSRKEEEKKIKKVNNNNVMLIDIINYEPPKVNPMLKKLKNPPVIVGMGPAGIFCGLLLARAGFCPVILEQGADVETRTSDVNRFWNGGELDTESNVQFGEGGAGTFSDGKLNTMIKDKTGRIPFVLQTFHEFGAPKEITYLNKPHIGTDVLHDVIKNMRQEIRNLGGKVLFHHKVTDLVLEDNKIKGLIINQKEKIDCELAVFAVGHSARDTFEMLLQRKVYMEPKAFAVGVRVEHPQSMIQENAYGNAPYELPPADYKVTCQTSRSHGVYSFCMCPGGYVVNASSEKNRTCVNGMSYAARDSRNANSAIVVTVSPQDYGGNDANPLAGMEFQRKMESLAYLAGEGKIPVQTYGDFVKRQPTTRFGQVFPTTMGEVKMSELNSVFPEYIRDSIIEGMESFAKNISGFNREDAILSAVESRTSSPVRITRNDEFMSNISGLIPCGEGAGYAGGITSASVDGMRVAESICRNYGGVQ